MKLDSIRSIEGLHVQPIRRVVWLSSNRSSLLKGHVSVVGWVGSGVTHPVEVLNE